MCKVSAIIPTHNRGARIAEALDSVFGQSLPPDEVIVVDDGSTDDTEALLRRRFPGIRYLRQAHRGVSAARNRGIEAARGRWLAFLDSDDRWMPEKLARQLAALEHRPAYRIAHTDEIWIRNGRRVNPGRRHAKAGGDIYARCLPLCAVSPSAVVVHRAVFREVGLFDETLPACEDYDMWLRICSRYPVHFLAEPLVVKHGGHDDQLSKKFSGLDRFRIRALRKMVDSGHLDGERLRLTVKTLIEKARIYTEGARKRQRHAEVMEYEALIARYAALL